MSNLQLLAIFIFLIFLPLVISRECYECYSFHSFKDCDAKRSRVTCFTSQPCVTASAHRTDGKIKIGLYVKGCAATCSPSEVSTCRKPNYKCRVRCCSSDYCNGASWGASTGASGGAFTRVPLRVSTGASVISRGCYKCLSTQSFKHCDANRSPVRCSPSEHCITIHSYRTSGIKNERYGKGCAATCSPSDIPICNSPNVKCEVHCCSSDNCNGASGGTSTGTSGRVTGRTAGGASGEASGPLDNGILLIITFSASFMYLFGQ